MARLVTSGGEIRDHPTSDIGSPDGYTAGAAATVTDTAAFRSGQASIKCPGTATDTSFRVWPFTAPASGASVFGRGYFWVDALPSATKRIGVFRTSADGALISVRLTSGGVFQLWNDVAGTQIGSDSTLVCEVNRVYRWQLRLKVDTGAVDEAELLVKVDDYQAVDESISGSSLTISDTHAARLLAGWVDAPGVTSSMWLDDVAVNDSTGTKQAGFPAEGRVAVVRAMSNAVIGSWTDCAGGTAPARACDKRPPAGLADHTTAGHTGVNAHQARVSANTAQTIDLFMRPYADAGVEMGLGFMAGTSTASQTIGQLTGNQRRAQSFKLGKAMTIDQIILRISRTGSPTDFLLELQTDSAGLPSGVALASVPIDPLVLATTPTKTVFNLGPAVPIAADTVYWIVVRRTGAVDSSNYLSWSRNTTNIYDEGAPATYDTSAWTQSGVNHSVNDHSFELVTTGGNWPPKFAYPVVCHGEATTGVKAGSIGGSMGAEWAGNFNFGDNVGVAGTYPANWRWARGGTKYDPPVLPDTLHRVTVTKASGTGTNACMLCFMGLVVEFSLPPEGWARYQKTADSTFWWAKRSVHETTLQVGTPDALVDRVIPAGDWAIYPEPQVAENENYPTTLTNVTDATLQAGYTLV